MRLMIDVKDEKQIPRFFGAAFICYERDTLVCCPIPLNHLLRWLVILARKLKAPSCGLIERLQDEAFNAGVKHGKQLGSAAAYKAGYEKAISDVRKAGGNAL